MQDTTVKAPTNFFASIQFWDIVERCILIVMFGYFLYPILGAVITRADMPSFLICISEMIVVILVCLRRRAKNMSMQPAHWTLALLATTVPMLVRPTEYSIMPSRDIPVTLMLLGMSIQIFGKINLGRRFGAVPANRGICHSGFYRWVRHPIYAGYMLTHIGFLLAATSWWNVGVYTVLYCLVIPRILAEEKFLSQDPEYRNYCKKVQFRLIPGVF
jgi:protein-S-isoprenylcysteine O-methyltransferase Ste14